MILEAKCQFCKMPLRLIIDEDYAALGDPQNLYRLAACDSCADYKQSRRQSFEKLKRLCELLATKQIFGEEALERARKNVKFLLMRWMVLLSKHRRLETPDWDDGILDSLMSNPAKLGSVLARISGMIKQERLL